MGLGESRCILYDPLNKFFSGRLEYKVILVHPEVKSY